MKSKSLRRRYYEIELSLIKRCFPFKNDTMAKVSLLPIKLKVHGIVKYFNTDINLYQNTNLSMRAISPNIVKSAINLERLVKHCKKNIFEEKDRQTIKLENVITYIFFTDDSDNVLNIENYVIRINEALMFLIDFFEKNRNIEGTQSYAICKTIYMHLEYIDNFIGDLVHIFLDKPIK